MSMFYIIAVTSVCVIGPLVCNMPYFLFQDQNTITNQKPANNNVCWLGLSIDNASNTCQSFMSMYHLASEVWLFRNRQ